MPRKQESLLSRMSLTGEGEALDRRGQPCGAGEGRACGPACFMAEAADIPCVCGDQGSQSSAECEEGVWEAQGGAGLKELKAPRPGLVPVARYFRREDPKDAWLSQGFVGLDIWW